MGSLQAEIFKRDPFESAELETALSILRTADILSRPAEIVLRGHGLSGAQYNVLRILRGMGGDGMPCGQIAQHMITREPDMTRLLDRLSDRELITRCRPDCDRRVVRVRLTPAALSLLDEIDEPLLQIHRNQFTHMKPEQLQTLIELLAVVRGGPPANSPSHKDGSL